MFFFVDNYSTRNNLFLANPLGFFHRKTSTFRVLNIYKSNLKRVSTQEHNSSDFGKKKIFFFNHYSSIFTLIACILVWHSRHAITILFCSSILYLILTVSVFSENIFENGENITVDLKSISKVLDLFQNDLPEFSLTGQTSVTL